MKNKIFSILSAIMAPVRKYPIPFLFLMGILYIPESCNILFGDYDYKLKIIIDIAIFRLQDNFCIYFLCAYLMISITYLLRKWNNMAAVVHLVLVHCLCLFLVFSDVFLYLFFGCHINAFILQMVAETNAEEASGFVSTYLLTADFLWIILSALALVTVELLASYLIHRYIRFSEKYKPWINGVGTLYLIYSLVYLMSVTSLFTFNARHNQDIIDKTKRTFLSPKPLSENGVWITYNAIVQYVVLHGETRICVQSQSLIGEPIKKGDTVKTLVWIIGESYDRHHASLYGYPLPTTPRLSALEDLVVYDDVITCKNGTSIVFKWMMSIASSTGDKNWSDVPLAPCIIKKAGVNVVFWSNQFTYSVQKNVWDAECGFFHHPGIAPYFYNCTATKEFQYDGDFIDDYKTKRDSLENGVCNLVILHLKGQHVPPITRFPKDQTFFSEKDYRNRMELSNEERQQVADYDNATRYNDSVVAEIIKIYEKEDALVLYFSDHGDEANDYRPHVGREHNLKSAAACHCQLDIPFMFYMTPLCREKHPDLCRRIEAAKHKPFMTDDTPHLLFDILGIQSKWYDPTKSPINPAYNQNRKRMILNGGDYDVITRSSKPWQIGY